MDRSQLNEWLTIATNIAVVVGIVILAIEIRQNSVALRSNVLQSVATEQNPLNLAIATDASMRATWLQGLRDPESLTESQALQLNVILHVWITNAQNWYYQMRNGVLDGEIADGHWTTLSTMHHSSPGFRQYWESRKYIYTPEFQGFVENKVLTRTPLETSSSRVGTAMGVSSEVEAITDQLDNIYALSAKAGNPDAMAEYQLQFFADQPTVLPPSQDAIVGREAVSRFYRRVFADFEILDNSYSNLSVRVYDGLAIREYVGRGTMTVRGQAESLTTVSQMTDVLIQDKGEWRTLVHSWSKPMSTE